MAVVFTVSPEICVARLMIRRNHEATKNIFPTDPSRIRGLVKVFKKGWRDVACVEGFDSVIKCSDSLNDQHVLNLISTENRERAHHAMQQITGPKPGQQVEQEAEQQKHGHTQPVAPHHAGAKSNDANE